MPDLGTQTFLEAFLDLIWAEDGLVYLLVGTRLPGESRMIKGSTEQLFFRWPAQKADVLQAINSRKANQEVYYAPALFNAPTADKESVRGAYVFWCEFDGNIPNELQGLPAPTVIVESSPGHQHWYWRVDRLIQKDELDKINRGITYAFGADSSGWDCTQILRPPETFNHKRSSEVFLKEFYEDIALNSDLFDNLPEPPPLPDLPIPESLPPVEDVVSKHKFPEKVWELFKSPPTDKRRSTDLMQLGYMFAEMNMPNEDVLAMLMNVDERWGKFIGRRDRLKRLWEIVTIARQKHPYKAGPEEKPSLLGWMSLLATTVRVDWVWGGWLQKGGYMLLTGPQGIGKTQVSLFVAAHFALGKDCLGRVVKKPRRVCFFSLEMGIVDLKEFMLLQDQLWTQEERELLEKNLLIFPSGEPLYLDNSVIQADLEQFLGDEKFDGIFVDSLGSMAAGDLAKGDVVKPILDWQDRMRQRLGLFVWFVHHHRKATSDNRKPNKLDDVYGHHDITRRTTSTFCLWRTDIMPQNTLEVLPLKVRLSARPSKFYIKRTPELGFTTVSSAAVENSPTGDINIVDEPAQQPTNGGVSFQL